MTEPTPTAYDDWEDGFDDDGHEDTCAHDEYEVDWEGRASCNYCRHHWWLTAAQLEAHHEAEAQFMAEYDRLRRREESRFWRTVDWLRSMTTCPFDIGRPHG